MRLLVGTRNPAKLREICSYLGDGFELVQPDDLLLGALDIKEDCKSYALNAAKKARAYFNWSGLPSVADDGGLAIDYLDGEPGVASRRWPALDERKAGLTFGREKTDDEMIDMALDGLRGVPWEYRTARLCVSAVFWDGETSFYEYDELNGYIVQDRPQRHEAGYPFRSIFWVPQFQKLFCDLTSEEHAQVNHRRRAFMRLGEHIRIWQKLHPIISAS